MKIHLICDLLLAISSRFFLHFLTNLLLLFQVPLSHPLRLDMILLVLIMVQLLRLVTPSIWLLSRKPSPATLTRECYFSVDGFRCDSPRQKLQWCMDEKINVQRIKKMVTKWLTSFHVTSATCPVSADRAKRQKSLAFWEFSSKRRQASWTCYGHWPTGFDLMGTGASPRTSRACAKNGWAIYYI